MDFEWLFKNFLSKSEFYIGVLSLAVALSATYFNFTSIPWMLVLLYCFLFFSLLTFAYRRYHAYIKKTKDKKKKEQEDITQQKEIERLIEFAFIGMNIRYKMEALQVIMKANSAHDNPYQYVISECHQYPLTHYDDIYTNPFKIDVNMGYIPLVTISQQQGYCIVSFQPSFHELIKNHATEIVNEYQSKYKR